MSEPSAPLVLVHGAWHGAWCWDGVADDLRARGREVHAITLPFHDQPGDRSRIWSTVRSYVAKVADIVEELDRPPILVGHSMGGYVVQRYLEPASGSASVAGAVLVASAPRRGILPFTARSLRRRPGRTVRALATLDLWPLVDGVAPDLFLGPDAPPAAVDLLGSKLQNESSVAAITMLVRWPRPQRITAPTSVVAAEHDAVFTLAEQRDLAAALGTDLVVLAAGHDLMLDVSAAALAEHLATWDPSAP